MAKGIGNKIYSGVATYGRIQAKIGAVFVFIIAIIMIGIAIFIYNSQSHLREVEGKVVDSSVCTQMSSCGNEGENNPNNQSVMSPNYWSVIVNDKNNDGYNPSCMTIKSCKTSVEYVVPIRDEMGNSINKTFRGVMDTGSTEYKVGDFISVHYDIKNPSDIKSFIISGWIVLAIIAIAVLLIVGSWSWVYVTDRSKVAAAVSGGAGIFGMVKDVLK